MSITKPKISSIIASQLPEFIRDDYPTFVAFLEAYYEYLETTQADLFTIRDLDKTLDNFIEFFQKEISVNAPNLPFGENMERFNLSRIKDQHLSKGSELSYKFLFRLLFNKNVTIEYPGRQILRASDGKWIQDVSLFARVNAGNPDDIVGRLVDVVTPSKIIRVLVDRRQDVEIEINRFVQILPDIYEFYIDRRFFGDLNVNDRIRYEGIFDATILPTTSRVQILQRGRNFRPGQLFNIRNGEGNGSILKVKSVDSTGGMVSAEFVKYGVGYETDFTSSLVASQDQTVTGAGGTSLNISTTTNGITGFVVNSGGTGFTTPPTVALSGGGFTTAATIGSVEISDGAITKINLATSGSGYVTEPTVLISGGGGTGASLTPIIGSQYNYVIAEGLNTFDEQGFINYSDYSKDAGEFWTPNTAVTAGSLIYFNDRLYTVAAGGTTNLNPPTHTTGTVSNGTATLTYTREYGPAFDGTYSGQTVRQFFVQSSQDTVDSENICIIKVELDALTKYPGYYQNNDGFLDDAIFIQDSRYYQAYSYVLKINEKLESYKSAVKTLVHPAGVALFGEYDIKNEFDIGASLEFLMKIFSLSAQDEVLLGSQISTKHIDKPLNGQLDYDGNTEDTKVVISEFETKLVTKGDFPETLIPSDIGSLTWTHLDFSGQTFTYANMPMLETTEYWEKYEDSFEFTDSHVIDVSKPLTESITPSESRDTMTFNIEMWAGWGEVYSLEDYFADDAGTYMMPYEFEVGGIVYPSEVAAITEAAAVSTDKYTTDTLPDQTELGIVWTNLYADVDYFEYNLTDSSQDFNVGRTQTF